MTFAHLAGTRPLLKVTLEQDRRAIAPWIVLITALSVTSILGYRWILTEPATRMALDAGIRANPAFSLLFGQPGDLSTADGFNAWRAGSLGGFFAALMAILIVVRHSRANEDSGQAELIASGPVGRHARLAVAIAVAAIASLLLLVVCSGVTILIGGGPTNSILLAATFSAAALMFTGVAAVTAQIASDARTASSMAVTLLGLSFLARGYADASGHSEWAWLSPLGWTQAVRPAVENNWWPLLACLALAVALAAVANVLLARRDFGMGLVPPAAGPARGGAVAGPWRLAFRLHRGAVLAWTAGFLVLGVVFGTLTTSLGDVFGSNPDIARIIDAGRGSSSGLTFQFLLTLLKLLGILAAVYGVQVVMRMYAEETGYRAEPLLAGALSRPRYLASNAAIALVGPTVALLAASAIVGLIADASGAAVRGGDPARQALLELPAVWTLIGLSLACVGAAPRVRPAAWLALVLTFALTILGPMFRLWDWVDYVLGISPFWHVPNVTAADPEYGGLLAVGLVAAALVAAGFGGYRRRDVI